MKKWEEGATSYIPFIPFTLLPCTLGWRFDRDEMQNDLQEVEKKKDKKKKGIN